MTNQQQSDEIFNEQQAAAFLKISRMTLFRWRDEGRIGCYRPGGFRVTYSKSAHLLPFLENCEQPAKRTSLGDETSDKK